MSGLPAEMTSFAGRRRDVAEARRLLSKSRLLTLTGVGGVGKTRLALRVADQVRRAFPDGVCLVELGALDEPGLLAQTVAKEVGLRDASIEPIARLTEYVENKRLLLVLDNCEHLVESCAMLVGKLLTTAHSLRVLATSRHVLGVEGEQLQWVSPLPVPDRVEGMERWAAISLFVDRASAAAPGFVLDERNREQVRTLCRHLDGIPLALELAAAWVRVLTPAEIVDRLEDRFSLLAKDDPNAPERQRTLAGTLGWSFQLCSPAEQQLWARLSVFTGGFDLQAAEQVCAGGDLERAEILSLFAGLTDKSILIRQPDTHGPRSRYRMLETIREYGRYRLAASGEEALSQTRHGECYQALALRFAADSFGPHQLEWVQHILADQANIRAAMEFALTGASHINVATDVATALWDFWYSAGFLREGYRWLRRALAVDTEQAPRRGHALIVCTFLGVHLAGEADNVQRMLVECAALAERFDDPALRAGHALSAGHAALHRGELAEACALLDDAVTGYHSIGDPLELVAALRMLAMAKLFTEEQQGAQAAARALAICRAHNANWTTFYALYVVALHKWRAGEHQQGAALLQQAIRMRLAVRDWSSLAHLLEALAWCAEGTGEPERAVRLLGGATAVWRLVGMGRNVVLPFETVDNELLERARAELGVDRFQAEFDTGLNYSIDQVVDEALEQQRSSNAASRRRASSTPLSQRQTQIAELIAQGLTNKDIAARLVISQRTAETHVENVLLRLGFTSRTQVATWFAEQKRETTLPKT